MPCTILIAFRNAKEYVLVDFLMPLKPAELFKLPSIRQASFVRFSTRLFAKFYSNQTGLMLLSETRLA